MLDAAEFSSSRSENKRPLKYKNMEATLAKTVFGGARDRLWIGKD
jgi:hypothetical protein